MSPTTGREAATMTAIIQKAYGAPEEVFTLGRTARPTPGAGEVLVRVHAAAVSGTDWHLYRGLPYAARPVTGLRRPRNPVPGLDLAGTVEAIGADVRTLEPGAEVFGWGAGSFAGYAAVPADQLLPRPANLTLEQAAAVPIAAFTALQAVRDRARVRSGQRVLITGASGGVGTYAVQIAKSYGAEVTGVCRTTKMDLVRSLGADHVIDYTQERLDARGTGYDALIDLYGNPPLAQCRRLLRPHGVLALVGGTGGRWFMGVDRWLRALAAAPFLRLAVRPLIHKDSLADLATLAELIEAGRVTPVVERTFPLAAAAQAIEYVRQGRARGQVVLVTGPRHAGKPAAG
jgi:NADPH:quinone reductase-like Zn-dependent oxidoreductase